MLDETAVALLVVVAAVSPALPAAASLGNEPPLADAGLDQTVQIGATVLLDGGGSRDPDGEIDSYRWEITAPNGSTLAPRCPTCERTRFVPTQEGVYEVTLTVTDDDGASRSDTLYVTVNDSTGPTVSLTGPGRTDVGEQVRYDVTVDAGDAKLAELVWRVDGTVVRREDLSGRHARKKLRRTFSTAGTRNVTVTAVDEAGNRASDSMTVDVVAPANDAPTASILGPEEVQRGETVSFDLVANDPDGDNLTVSWTNVDSGNRTGATKNFSGYAVGDTVTITATVTDAQGASVTVSKTVEVVSGDTSGTGGTNTAGPRASNEEPTAKILGPDTVRQGRWATFRVEANDPDGTIIDIAWSNVHGTGVEDPLSVTREFDGKPGTTVSIRVTVTDDDGATATATHTVTITGGGPAPGDEARGPDSTATPTSTPTEGVESAVQIEGVTMMTMKGGGYNKKTSTIKSDVVEENSDTLKFNVDLYVENVKPGEIVEVTFNFDDGNTSTLRATVQTDGTLPTLTTTHNFAPIDTRTTRTITITAITPDGTDAKTTREVTFSPSNEQAQQKKRFGVEVQAPDKTTRGKTTAVTVTDSGGDRRNPDEVVVTFGDGTKTVLYPPEHGDWSKKAHTSWSSTGTYTVKAAAEGHVRNGQVNGGSDTIEVVAETYIAYTYNKKKQVKKSKTKRSWTKPGPEWRFVRVVQRKTKVVDTVTQPASMGAPRASGKYSWRQTGTTYDPMTGMTMVTYEKLKTKTKVEWKNTWTTSKKGEEVHSLTKPPSRKVWKNTLSKEEYKCTNDNAPLQDRACADTKAGGVT